MTIDLYLFDKKTPSAELPGSGHPTIQASVVLKDACSVTHPVFSLQSIAFETVPYNYLKATIGGKTRYYFIRENIYITNALREIRCEEDYLGTWWAAINTKSYYIGRASAQYDGNIIDSTAITKAAPTISLVDSTSDVFDADGGFFVVGFTGIELQHPAAERGSVAYVIMTGTQIEDLIQSLYMNTRSTPLSVSSIFSAALDPLQYIASCTYIPMAIGDYTANSDTTTESVNFEPFEDAITINYTYGAPKSGISGIIEKSVTITLPDHPQKTTYPFANFAPFSKHYCSFGPFGEFEIDRSEAIGATLTVKIVVDICDGTGVAHICGGSSGGITEVMTTRRGKVGVEIQLSQVRNNPLGIASAALGAMAAATNPVTALLGLSQTALSAVDAAIPKVTSTGLNGSLAEVVDIGAKIKIHSLFYSIADINANFIGRPVCAEKQLSSFTGTGAFVICEKAKVAIPGLKEEIDALDDILNTGFFTD